VLLPFAFLPIAVLLERVLQQTERTPGCCRALWAGAAGVFLIIILVPGLLTGRASGGDDRTADLRLGFAGLPPAVRNATLLTDQPGPFVSAGKRNVIGTRGQTDWRILVTSTAYGGFQTSELLRFLQDRGVELLHLSDPEDPLVDRLKLEPNAPEFTPVNRLAPPHRLFLISWP